MAFTVRNSARILNSITSKQNRNGAQELSAPGPRQGEGGQNVSLSEAETAMSTPITQSCSPAKMNAALVAGAADVGKKFIDVGAEVGKVFNKKDPKPVAADLDKTTQQ